MAAHHTCQPVELQMWYTILKRLKQGVKILNTEHMKYCKIHFLKIQVLNMDLMTTRLYLM